jgi:hypothetical protein
MKLSITASDFTFLARVTDVAARLSLFLTGEVGSTFGTWKGRLSAAQQRALFGKVIGKGLLYVDGNQLTVTHVWTVCFGSDFDQKVIEWGHL